ncbi:hypothetical protein LEMLEM_LOCUS21611, partial [Lemmus lemmus]
MVLPAYWVPFQQQEISVIRCAAYSVESLLNTKKSGNEMKSRPPETATVNLPAKTLCLGKEIKSNGKKWFRRGCK